MDPRLPCILHAIDTTGPGGAETVFLDLAENLKVEGYRSIAVIKGAGWVEDQLKARGIDYYVIKPSGALSLNYYWQLAKILRRDDVRLIQAHLLGSTLTYSILGSILRIPVVATLHGRVDVNPAERFIYLKQQIMRRGVKRLVTVSRDLASYIEKRKLFNKKDISIIYNGVNTERYGKTTTATIRQQLGLPDDAILIGSVGNVRPAKAYDILIKAAKEVISHNRKIHFVIAGHQKPALMTELNALINEYRLDDNVHFLGFQQSSADFLSQMNLFVLSSSSEGFSISTIEAMATGLPVLVTRCGGPEEIVKHGETGLMVRPNDANALAEALLQLIADKPLQRRLAIAGQQHVQETFSMARLLTEYRHIFQALLPANPEDKI